MQNRNAILLIFIASLTFLSCSKKTDEKLAASSKKPDVEIRNFNMVYVEGGAFMMGNKKEDDTFPHKVSLSDFYISDIEVTQELYSRIMKNNPSSLKYIGKNKPVNNITWYEAVEFCNKLSIQEGYETCYVIDGENTTCDFKANGYRLPTEAEWEFAARGGKKTNGYEYSGCPVDKLDDYGWCAVNSDCTDELQEVAKKQPNELNIYDMSGNVDEWCWDWYDSNYYANSEKSNPSGPENKSLIVNNQIDKKTRVERGGNFEQPYYYCSVYYRSFYPPEITWEELGFRICRTKLD